MKSSIKSRLACDSLLICAIIIVTATNECLTVGPSIEKPADEAESMRPEELIGDFFRENMNRLESTGRGFANHLINTIQEAPAVAASELQAKQNTNTARSYQNAAIQTAFTDKQELADSPLAGGGAVDGSFGGQVTSFYNGYYSNYLKLIKDLALKLNLPLELIVTKCTIVGASILESILSKCNFIIKFIEKHWEPDECMLNSVCTYGHRFNFAKSFVEKINPVTLEQSIFVRAMGRGILQTNCGESYACTSGSTGTNSIATAGLAGQGVSKTQINGIQR